MTDARLRTQAKATPTPFYAPIGGGLLQRKCACGGTPGPTGECEAYRKKKLQRKAQTAGLAKKDDSGIPPIVHEVLRSSGDPLDASTRAFMEPRFGHDFSRVRVHRDAKASESARALDALAYTVSNELVFAAGQYQPASGMGRMLIAHELAHTIQQRNRIGDAATGNDLLEHEAHSAVSAAMRNRPVALSSAATPPIQFVKVTAGALGKALEEFTNTWSVPDKAIALLQRSPSFMKVAATIDNNYVWRGDSYLENPVWDHTPDGRIRKGKFKGKRELFDVIRGEAKFETFETPPEANAIKLSGDVISLHSIDTPNFVAEIAHEATHAARFVGMSAPPPKTIVDEVNASITDEVETRKSEAKILGEIGTPEVTARIADVGSRISMDVERDITPAFGMTYMENAFFGARLRETQTSDGITDEEAETIRAEVGKEFKAQAVPKPTFHFKPRPNLSGLMELSDYGDIWFNRRLTQVEWQEFQKNHSATDSDFAAEKEKLLQEHARRFFEGRVSYQPLPKPPPVP
jgi:hypothetical protein